MNKNKRIGQENYNHQGCLMKIIEYNKAIDVVVEFQDEYKAKVHTQYGNFQKGNVKNPYYPMVYGVGVIGDKYPSKINNKPTKEYKTWKAMLQRSLDKKYKKERPTYKDVTCCEEWLYYPNFYEWLHNQDNFDKWLDGKQWCLDKDILLKGNKIYSPDTCCLVPNNVNTLFIKRCNDRGALPIGVKEQEGKFRTKCSNQITNKEYIKYHNTLTDAFLDYKYRKESLIKQVAKLEYNKRNITKTCYEAMMKYEVDIDD